jgi:membrane-associated phospholipid phosphatase
MIALRRWILSFGGTALACAVSYQFLDRPIALFFQRTVAQPKPLAELTHFPDPIVPLTVITFVGLGLWNLSGRTLSRFQKCALLCSISLIVAEATKAQLKFVFGRTWPETWIHNNPSFVRDGIYGFNFFNGGAEYASFPSGHMAVTCAVISVLWLFFPTGRTLYALAGMAVAIGLIGANFHFLSDVIAGAFVGISSGWMVTSLWKAHEQFDMD